MVLELRAIAQRIGRTPTTTDMEMQALEKRANSLKVYYAVFGSYREAVRKAGLQPRYPNVYNREMLLEEIRAVRRQLKRPLMKKDLRDAWSNGRLSPLYRFERVFETIGKAITAAGAGKKECDRWEMIAILSKLGAKLDRPVRGSDIDVLFFEGKGPSSSAIRRQFGSLREARRAAGIKMVEGKAEDQTRYGNRYTNEEVIGQLRALGKRLGRKATCDEIDKASKEGLCASASTFAKKFGGLTEAHLLAGFESVKPVRYTDKEIIAALKRLTKKLGRFPTSREINNASMAGECPCMRTIITRLGKLSEISPRF